MAQKEHVIRGRRQVDLLASPLRQRIVGVVASDGPCSAREIASELGLQPSALYYHLRKLTTAGLLVSEGLRSAARRPEEIFRTRGRVVRVRYDVRDRRLRGVIARAVGAALRLAERDFKRGARLAEARNSGPQRNLAASRTSGWLSRSDLAAVNRHLAEIEAILERGRRGPGRRLQAFTWLLAPLEVREEL